MPARIRKPMTAIDPKAATVAAETGVNLKPARLTVARDKFMLRVGTTQRVLMVGETIVASEAKKLLGRDTVAVVSGKTIAAIGRKLPGCYWIICYIPAPDLIRKIRPELRNQLVQKFVQEKVIPEKFGNELMNPR